MRQEKEWVRVTSDALRRGGLRRKGCLARHQKRTNKVGDCHVYNPEYRSRAILSPPAEVWISDPWKCQQTWVCSGLFYGKWSSPIVLVAQSGLTLCDPMDCRPPVSSVHRILQARILEVGGGWLNMPKYHAKTFTLNLTQFYSFPEKTS